MYMANEEFNSSSSWKVGLLNTSKHTQIHRKYRYLVLVILVICISQLPTCTETNVPWAILMRGYFNTQTNMRAYYARFHVLIF